MSDSVIKLVDAIKAGDAMATEQSFADAMAEKLSARIDALRQSTAASMFSKIEESDAGTLAESEEDHAGKFASEVAKRHPHMVTSEDPDKKGTHWLQHKDDDDGSMAGGLKIRHSKKTGKISVQQHGTAMNDEPENHSGTHEKMHAHIDNTIKHAFPKNLDD